MKNRDMDCHIDPDQEIDRILSRDDEILPSSGFAATVMEAVRREAATPPPIPFPWKRALPGIVLTGAVLVGTLGLLVKDVVRLIHDGGEAQVSGAAEWTSAWGPWLNKILNIVGSPGVEWTVIALGLSLVSVVVSLQLTSRRI